MLLSYNLNKKNGQYFKVATLPSYEDIWQALEQECQTEVSDATLLDKVMEFCASSLSRQKVYDLYPEEDIKLGPYNATLYYVLISALQKAIRTGRTKDALRYYRLLCQTPDRQRATSRLKVIVLEDIGVVDPLLCHLILKMCNGPTLPQWAFETLIVLAAGSLKCRMQTHLLMPLYWDGYLKSDNAMAHRVAYGLGETGEGEEALQVYLDLLYLRGAPYMEFFKVPVKPKFQKIALQEYMADLFPDPAVQRFLNALASDRIYVPFIASFPIAMLSAVGSWKEQGNPFPEPKLEYLGNHQILSSAFDSHTMPGKKAQGYVYKSHEAYFENVPGVDKSKQIEAFSEMVFEVESGYLNRPRATTAMLSLMDSYFSESLKSYAWPDKNVATVSHLYLHGNLEPLNHARRRIWE
jgi:hypothetical protein